MSEIFLYTFAALFVLFFLGTGLSLSILPQRLLPFAFWLAPWCASIFIIFILTIASLLGFSVNQTTPFVVFFLTSMTVYMYKRKKIPILIKEDILIALIVLASIIFNLSPLILRDRFLTSISMGNNDIIAYAVTADYLKDASLLTSFLKRVSLDVSDPLHIGYRWGSPLIASFFLSLFRLDGYQFIYVLQVIFFAAFIPLVYSLFKLLYKKSFFGLLLSLSITAFNVNLLYILYHNFFGQVLFWGIEMFILLMLVVCSDDSFAKKNTMTIHTVIIGVTFVVLYFTYHEAVIFIVLPIIIYFFIHHFLRRTRLIFWLTMTRIALLVFLFGSVAFFHAFVFDFEQAFLGNPNQSIGWERFRDAIPYANPFEAMGLYSIHSFEPLPRIIAVILSILVCIVILYGIIQSRKRHLITSLTCVAIYFYYWTAIQQHNFWTYHRALTYTLPFFIIFFSVGITDLMKHRKYMRHILFFLLIGLVSFMALKLNKRFLKERLSVNASYVSIKELRNKVNKEYIYIESFLNKSVPLWDTIWMGYFLYEQKTSSPPEQFFNNAYTKRAPHDSLILFSKGTPSHIPLKLLLKEVLWENEYFKLGRVCDSETCLLNRMEDLSYINFGASQFEDSLLISGWSTKEADSRWAEELKSTLLLVTKKQKYTKMVINARTLKQPQKLSAYIDDELIGELQIRPDWQIYDIPLKKPLQQGIHRVSYSYSHVYVPSQLGMGDDNRRLSVDFKEIRLL